MKGALDKKHQPITKASLLINERLLRAVLEIAITAGCFSVISGEMT